MRIRRPPLPYLSSSPLLVPDPSPPLQPPKGIDEPKERGGGGEEEGLHPHGNLSAGPHGLGRDLTRRAPQDPNPSDPHPTMGGRSPSLLAPAHLPTCCIPPPNPTHVQVLKEAKKEETVADSNKGSHGQVNSNKRNRCSSGAQSSGASPAGESFVPPKKRRGGYDVGVGDGCSEETLIAKEKKAKAKAKARVAATSADNNCTSANGDNEDNSSSRKCDGGVAKEERDGNGSNSGKKRRSPAVLMEGSRCSRVNGRGWRCCQQTLVGYSLCEHHLGKGRLRSMSSVRGQLGTNDKPKKNAEEGDKPRLQQCAGVLGNGDLNGIELVEEEKPARKKRKKIGMVKARSISSLLDDTNHPAPPVQSSPWQPILPEVAPMPGSNSSTEGGVQM